MTDAEFQISPPGVCRRPYSRDVGPRPSGLAVSDTNNWFKLGLISNIIQSLVVFSSLQRFTLLLVPPYSPGHLARWV